MKILALLLSLYFLSLSFTACADSEVFSSSKVKIEKTSNHSQSSEIQDVCSPFCSCSCCVGFTKPLEITFKLTKPKPTLVQSLYLEKSYYSTFRPLFQPPKY